MSILTRVEITVEEKLKMKLKNRPTFPEVKLSKAQSIKMRVFAMD